MPRGKIAARQFLPLNCRAITLTTGALLKEEKMSSLVGRGNLGGILRDNLVARVSESQKLRETVGSQFLSCEASRCLAGPSGLGLVEMRDLSTPIGLLTQLLSLPLRPKLFHNYRHRI